MKPIEVFGKINNYSRVQMRDIYKHVEHKDCIFLRWGDKNNNILVHFNSKFNGDDDVYFCFYTKENYSNDIDMKDYPIILWSTGEKTYTLLNDDKRWKPKIVDNKLYEQFKDYLLVEAI